MEQTKTIFISTIVILLSTLLLVIYILKITNKTYVFPPHINECPDYYYMKTTGECYDKNNVFYDISNVCYIENFNKYTNVGTGTESKLCKQKTWADKCDLSWDGITNNTELCI
jgi:hypothetical protein